MNEPTRRAFIFGAATVAAGGLLLGVQRILSSAFADSAADSASGPVTIEQFGADGTPAGVASVPRVHKTEDQWKKQLTPLQFEVTRLAGTERAFTGPLNKEYAPGLYRCI